MFNSTFMCYFQVSSVKPTAHVENHYTVMVIIQAFCNRKRSDFYLQLLESVLESVFDFYLQLLESVNPNP